jgi:hypothetical protein
MLALAMAGLVLVIYAGPLYEFGHAAAVQLEQPGGYLSAVLQPAAGGMPE